MRSMDLKGISAVITGGASGLGEGEWAAKHPDDQRTQRAEHQRCPEKRTAGDGKIANILFRVGLGDLTGADGVYAHGGNGRRRIHQAAIEADQADAGWTEQYRQHLGADESNGNVEEGSSSDDGRAFQNAPVGGGSLVHWLVANLRAVSCRTAITRSTSLSRSCGPKGRLSN